MVSKWGMSNCETIGFCYASDKSVSKTVWIIVINLVCFRFKCILLSDSAGKRSGRCFWRASNNSPWIWHFLISWIMIHSICQFCCSGVILIFPLCNLDYILGFVVSKNFFWNWKHWTPKSREHASNAVCWLCWYNAMDRQSRGLKWNDMILRAVV